MNDTATTTEVFSKESQQHDTKRGTILTCYMEYFITTMDTGGRQSAFQFYVRFNKVNKLPLQKYELYLVYRRAQNL